MTFGANFSDGYALGIIGALLPILTTKWVLSGFEQGMLASSALIGLFFGSMVLGRVGDIIGRQRVYVLNFILIAVASLLQLWAPGLWVLFVLRVLIGFGLGADYAVGPTLQSEFAPRKQRGFMLASLTVLWTVGYVVANVLGVLLVGTGDAWRWLLASGAIPAIVVLLVRIGAPESPGWLISRGRVEEARAIVRKHLGVELTDAELVTSVGENASNDYRRLFVKGQAKRTWFGVVFYSALVLPYFAIYTFVPTIFENLKIQDANLQYIILNFFLLVGGIAGLWLVQRYSRRAATFWSFVVLAVSLLVLGLTSGMPAFVLMIPFAVYTFVMSAASNLTQVYPPELFPTPIRSSGVGLLNGLSRIASAAGTFLLPLMLTGWGIAASMYVLAAVLAVGAVFTWWWAPETSKNHLV
ncbi:MFS transporter, putative metabolite transport protein [Propionibacterium cyclohexanicum]|uniref:MFS transporter, putative metabolite transport protein n=2 Tax=Propionibacterium cyclohexanicum TaxID=64702 RepID=A0A1H9SNQ2_9ACTN|nr:MFS transporter, putative metabolite transport protein [Propionibacterium cyclohexanicum]